MKVKVNDDDEAQLSGGSKKQSSVEVETLKVKQNIYGRRKKTEVKKNFKKQKPKHDEEKFLIPDLFNTASFSFFILITHLGFACSSCHK